MYFSPLRSVSLLTAAALLAPAGRADDPRQADPLREKVRLLEQINELRQLVAERDKQLAELRAQVEETRRRMIQSDVERKVLNERNANLMQRIAELEKQLAVGRAEGGKAVPPRVPDAPINGKVAEVDGESQLVRLDIGSDAGLQAGQQLQVYRLGAKPEEAKYLGVLEVLQVRPTSAVARPRNRLTTPLRAGDQVTSRLPDEPKKP